MKRALSESECEDVFDECKDGDNSCEYGSQRKRRRGVIEKRRRDRINTSLSELRRLVPTAFEKQGSAKLEKAEILQMTVDHLKLLHAKGLDALAYDPNKFAMDYHSIGFRECAAEVARYLVTVEGMDIQDPLRLRLMSHLQCYSAQRELANKQHNSGWGFQSYPGAMPGGSCAPEQSYTAPFTGHCGAAVGMASSTVTSVDTLAPPPIGSMPRYNMQNVPPGGTTMQPYTTPVASLAPTVSGVGHPASVPSVSGTFSVTGNQQVSGGYVNGAGGGNGGSKPYRPWGTELAY